jgi:D-threo-aldose 1-dehydrogenase
MTDPILRRPCGRARLELGRLGVGTGTLANAGGADMFDAMIDAAWSSGLRHFDTAAFYLGGESERRLGAALSGRPRSDYILSTKAGRYLEGSGSRFDYSRDGFLRSVDASLHRLQVECLDIVMIHDLTPEQHGAQYKTRLDEAVGGAYVALEELRRQGLVRAIGIGAMNWQACLNLSRRCPLDCVMLAGDFSLLRQGSGALLEHCLAADIAVLVASPFNTGILATGAIAGARYLYQPAPADILDRTRALEAICQRHGVPLAAAALQFPLRHPAVASVVAGHQMPGEIATNLELLRRPIPEKFWAELSAASR